MTDIETFICEVHGAYEARQGRFVMMDWDCAECTKANRDAEQAWERDWAIYDRWLRCGLPHRYRNRTLDNWVPDGKAQAAILSAARVYAGAPREMLDHGRGLLLTGPVGTGKTHIAAGIVHRVIAAGFSAKFERVGDFFAKIKAGFGKGAEPFDDQPLRRAAFLVLDDIGASRGSEWEVSVMHDLLAHRYDQELPSIITTNEQNLELVLGERIADRLQENALRLTLAGASNRKAAGENRLVDLDGVPEPARVLKLTSCSRGTMRTETHVRKERGAL